MLLQLLSCCWCEYAPDLRLLLALGWKGKRLGFTLPFAVLYNLVPWSWS